MIAMLLLVQSELNVGSWDKAHESVNRWRDEKFLKHWIFWIFNDTFRFRQNLATFPIFFVNGKLAAFTFPVFCILDIDCKKG